MTNDGSFCPACERFIGPVDACPYCGTDSAKAPALNILRYAALLLGLIGLILLYYVSTNKNLELIRIGNITPLMNYAYVCIEGTVEKSPYIGRKENVVDYISFFINDGSGMLRVTALGDVAEKLVSQKLLPVKGSHVDAAGSLRVSSGKTTRLCVQSIDQLKIKE